MRYIMDLDIMNAPAIDVKHLEDLLGSLPWITLITASKDGREGESQPMPVISNAPDIQSAVIADLAERRKLGVQRYGTALQPFNGRNAMQDAYDEVLDLACYLKQKLVEEATDEGARLLNPKG